MKTCAPLALAHKVAPLLDGLAWGVGGSVLLYTLGLEAAPHDLDLVVSEQDFAQAEARLLAIAEPLPVTPHPSYRSRHFARFAADDGTAIELIAGVASHLGNWTFQPERTELRGGVRWMAAEDWVELYRLFGRPYRVAQLENWLAARVAQRRADELEIRAAWLDDTVDALSQTLARQQQELDLLQEQLRLLYRQTQRGGDDGATPRSLRDEIPPHY